MSAPVAYPEPYACAAFVIVAFCLAGAAHVAWMRSPLSKALAIPIDGGACWRGRRVFGDHKTLRGFLAIVPAAGAAFAALGAAREALLPWFAAGIWSLTPPELFIVGAWAAFWFMAGELPNSFMKRQWGIVPGAVPAEGAKRALCLALDRVDSILAMLVALAVAVPLPWLTALLLVTLGPAVHLSFSALLWLAHVKERLA
jgi:CDP-2,3-bis-(O-geranylgeranyl)-sn-glycerol synthase